MGCHTTGMTSKEIVTTARQHLDAHGYEDIPIELSRAKTILGQAQFKRDRFGDARPHILKLSETILTRIGEDEVVDTILHEIAHFKAGLKAGHGAAWKAACRAIGAQPSRLAELEADLWKRVKAEISKYRLTCEACGQEYHRNRLPKGRTSFVGYRCGKCSGPLKTEVLK